MRLSRSEIRRVARLIAPIYLEPATVTVEVPQPPRRKTVEERRPVRRTVSRETPVDNGASIGWFVMLAVGLGAAILLYLGGKVPYAAATAVATVVACAIGYSRMRSIEMKPTSAEETVEEMVAVEVEEPAPPRLEERPAPGARRVTGVGRATLRCLALPVRGRTLLVPALPVGDEHVLVAPELADPAALRRALADFERTIQEIPAVLESDGQPHVVSRETSFGKRVVLHGLEHRMKEQLERVSVHCGAVAERTLKIQTLGPVRAIAPLLRRSARNGPVSPPVAEARALVAYLRDQGAEDLDRALTAALRSLALVQGGLNVVRGTTLRGLVAPVCHNLGNVFHYSAFHFYCPRCTRDLRETILQRDYTVRGGRQHPPVQYSRNTRCLYDASRGLWQCRTCEAWTDQPVPVHRMLDELLLPAYDRLLEENKNARLGVYAEAENREAEYSNAMETELEQIFQRNRDALEELNREQQRLEAEVAGEEEAVRALNEVMGSFRLEQEGIVKRMLATHSEIAASIQRDRTEAAASQAAVFEREREAALATMRACSRAKRIEDEKRDAVSRQIAANTHAIQQNTHAIKQNTGTMVGQLGRIEQNTHRTAVASERTATNTTQLVQQGQEQLALSRQSNAIQAAMAGKMGVTRHAAWYDVGGQLATAGAGAVSWLTGEDDVAASARLNEVLR